MSTWKLAARMLHQLGGSATGAEVANCLALNGHVIAPEVACRRLAELGLIIAPKRGGVPGDWVLTQLGEDWCEGRVTVVAGSGSERRRYIDASKERKERRNAWSPHPHRKARFVATWLSSLPRGISLGAQQ